MTIRQLAPKGSSTPSDFVLRPGSTYFLFLTPFTFGPATPDLHQYVVTGQQGAYAFTGGPDQGTDAVLHLVPGIETGLPVRATLGDLEGAGSHDPQTPGP